MSALLDGIAQRLSDAAQGDLGIGAAVVKFDAGQDGVLVVDATATPADISTADRSADCVIKIAAPLLMKAVAGEIPVGAAFMKFVRGVQGRPGLAVQVQPFLRKVAARAPL